MPAILSTGCFWRVNVVTFCFFAVWNRVSVIRNKEIIFKARDFGKVLVNLDAVDLLFISRCRINLAFLADDYLARSDDALWVVKSAAIFLDFNLTCNLLVFVPSFEYFVRCRHDFSLTKWWISYHVLKHLFIVYWLPEHDCIVHLLPWHFRMDRQCWFLSNWLYFDLQLWNWRRINQWLECRDEWLLGSFPCWLNFKFSTAFFFCF